MNEFVVELLKYLLPCLAINAALNLWYLWKLKNPKIAQLDGPLDCNWTLPDHQRLLGQSTTWVGIVVAIATGIAIEIFLTTPIIGTLKGLTVYFGHALGSFTKRRLKLPRGNFLPIIDHGDSIILTGIVFYFGGLESGMIVLIAIIATLLVQPLITFTSYKLGWRDNPL